MKSLLVFSTIGLFAAATAGVTPSALLRNSAPPSPPHATLALPACADPDYTDCDDGDPCTKSDICLARTCFPLVAYDRPPGSPVDVGAYADAVSVGDLNHDGHDDLVVTNQADSRLSILLGDGAGGFSPAAGSPIAINSFPGQTVLADFDLDGNLDIAVVGYFPSGVTVLLGNGKGQFHEAPGPPMPVVNPYGIVAADFNRDGIPDIAVDDIQAGTFSTFLGNGTGAFARPWAPAPIGPEPSAPVTADFNHDGIPDLAVPNDSQGTVSIRLGDGAGGFVEPQGSPLVVGPYAVIVRTADFDRDGNPDLAVAQFLGAVTIFLGDGTGGFAPTAASPFVAGGYVRDMFAVDVNRDGAMDLAVVEEPPGIVVYFGDGRGHFVTAPLAELGIGPGAFGAATGDFDGNGWPDFAVLSYFDGNASIHLGRPYETAAIGTSCSTPCTVGGSCSENGTCNGTPVSCDDGDGCTTDSCDPHAGCIHSASDETPPFGEITGPARGVCFGPASLPVFVTDDFSDTCDASLDRRYTPAPGPAYVDHGDHHVVVRAVDDAGNASAAAIAFTIDTVPPRVWTYPLPSGSLPSGPIPASRLFSDHDVDGAAGDVVHEVIKIQGCPAYDGDTYGDRDGLLRDEMIDFSLPQLCRIASECGFDELINPVLSVEATDCGGNVGIASETMRGSLKLSGKVCGRLAPPTVPTRTGAGTPPRTSTRKVALR